MIDDYYNPNDRATPFKIPKENIYDALCDYREKLKKQIIYLGVDPDA